MTTPDRRKRDRRQDLSSAFGDEAKPAKLSIWLVLFICLVLTYIVVSCVVSTPAWIVHWLRHWN